VKVIPMTFPMTCKDIHDNYYFYGVLIPLW
jgi:hypothetical protein